MKNYIVVDVEADGPCPGEYSMVCFGAVNVADMSKTFYAELAPISSLWVPDALAVSGFTREEHVEFPDPVISMFQFREWLKSNVKGQPVFFSDNVAFDWQFINYYFHRFLGENPFGYSGRRIGDLYCGYKQDMRYSWKKHRITKHTHAPVDDAKGNAEALKYLLDGWNKKSNS